MLSGKAFPGDASLPVKINSPETFIKAFKRRSGRWNLPVVLLFDEFDKLLLPEASTVRSDCLGTMWASKTTFTNLS